MTYRVKPGRDFRASDDGQYLLRTTRQYLGIEAKVDVEIVHDLPSEPSGSASLSQDGCTE